MKRKIILFTVLSAMLLTACHSDGQDFNATEPTVSAATTQKPAETEVTETEDNSKLKMRFFDYKSIDPTAGDYNGYTSFIIRDNILFVPFNTLYDINDNTLFKKLDVPADPFNADNWSFSDSFDDSKEILYKRSIFRWVGNDTEDAFVTIYDDYTYEIADYTIENSYFKHFDRRLAEWQCNMYDLDTGEIIIKGYNPGRDEYAEEWGWDTSTPCYQYPIDENRFVYQTSGVNALACIGVYDFETGEAKEIPNSADMQFLGFRDGKIYSYKELWEENTAVIYTTDVDSFETEVYMEWSRDGMIYFAMSEDGKYIAVFYANSLRFYVIDTDTKETFNGDIPEELTNPTPICFADNDTVIIADWEDKILLIDIK